MYLLVCLWANLSLDTLYKYVDFINCLKLWQFVFKKCLHTQGIFPLGTYTAQMAAIIRKPSWSPKQSNGAVITTMENQTSFGENLQFSFKTEGFQTQLFCWKNLQFQFKTEGNTNCPIKLKQKVFQGKPSVFFSKKLKKN